MISALQIIVIGFAIFAVTRAFLRLREGKLSIGQAGFWTVVWSGVVALVVNPDLANILSEAVGISRPIDAVVYLSIMLLFYMIFRLYVMISDIEKEITELVTKSALRKK